MREILDDFHAAPPDPHILGVIPHAIPIYWFGDTRATVATVGINPGPAEFEPGTDDFGYWRQRRDYGTHRTRYTAAELDTISSHCDNYFQRWRPGDAFWNRLETLLSLGGASYFRDGAARACHVDLVPWATGTVWSKLRPPQRARLLEHAAEARARMFAKLEARVLICRGASATSTAGQTLGFFTGTPPWRTIAEAGDFVVVRHPDRDRWLIGTRAWYFDRNVAASVGKALRELLAGVAPGGGAGGNPPVAAGAGGGPPFADPERLLDMLRGVAREVATTEGVAVALRVEKTASTCTVWLNNSRNRKVATVDMRGGQVEFPAFAGVHAAAAALTPPLVAAPTWHGRQVCVSGIPQLIRAETLAQLHRVMRAAIIHHPHFRRE
jgi:hypothetical protein